MEPCTHEIMLEGNFWPSITSTGNWYRQLGLESNTQGRLTCYRLNPWVPFWFQHARAHWVAGHSPELCTALVG